MIYGRGDYDRYPFLPGSEKCVSNLTQAKVVEDRPLVERALRRIEAAVRDDPIVDVDVQSFIVAIMLIRSTRSKVLAGRFALAEARRSETFLRQDKPMYIISAIFGEDVREEGGMVYIKVPTYLTHSANFTDKSWKLVNQVCHDGEVVMPISKAVRLVREASVDIIRHKIIHRWDGLTEPDWALDKVASIAKDIEPKRSKPTGAFAPCVRTCIKRLKDGENVSHNGRFLTATYLLMRDMDPEDVAKYFENAPDYNPNITAYQISTLKKYKCPGCETLKSRGLCTPDNGCTFIRHPMGYGRKG